MTCIRSFSTPSVSPSFYSCAIWLAEHKFSVNYVYMALVKRDDWLCVRNNIFLKIQEQMRSSWKVISSVAVSQRCWGKLGWCHITYNSESSFAELLMRTGCSRKTNFLRRTTKQKGAHLRSRNGENKESFDLDLAGAKCSLVLGPLTLRFYSIPILEGLIEFQWKYALLS